MAKIEPNAFEAELKAEGYEVNISSSEARKTGDHSHDFHVKALVTAGAITLSCEGETRTYGPGDVFTMAAGAIHTEEVGPEGVSYVVGRRDV